MSQAPFRGRFRPPPPTRPSSASIGQQVNNSARMNGGRFEMSGNTDALMAGGDIGSSEFNFNKEFEVTSPSDSNQRQSTQAKIHSYLVPKYPQATRTYSPAPRSSVPTMTRPRMPGSFQMAQQAPHYLPRPTRHSAPMSRPVPQPMSRPGMALPQPHLLPVPRPMTQPMTQWNNSMSSQHSNRFAESESHKSHTIHMGQPSQKNQGQTDLWNQQQPLWTGTPSHYYADETSFNATRNTFAENAEPKSSHFTSTQHSESHGMTQATLAESTKTPSRPPELRTLVGTIARAKEWISKVLPFPVLIITYGRLFCAVKSTVEGLPVVQNDAVQDLNANNARATRFQARKVSPTGPVGPPKADKRRKNLLILQDLHDPTQKLRCIFYNIDRSLPTYNVDTELRVIGKPQKDGSLLIFNYYPAELTPAMSRLVFFSQRAVQQGINQCKKAD